MHSRGWTALDLKAILLQANSLRWLRSVRQTDHNLGKLLNSIDDIPLSKSSFFSKNRPNASHLE